MDGEQDKDFLISLDSKKSVAYLFWSYAMNFLNNSLYDVYYVKKSVKELCESLTKNIDWDARAKKFVVDCFLTYKMMDSKTIISQVQEFQVIPSLEDET